MAKNNNLKDFVAGVAGAIREKKGTTQLINPQDFENEILTIQTGIDTSDATAVAGDIRLGKTAYGTDGKMTGTIADYDGTSEPASGKSLFVQRVDGTLKEFAADDLEGISSIGDYAFYRYSSLTSITIPNSVTSIGAYAFSGCSSLTSITIPKSIIYFGVSIFSGCSSLTSITIEKGVDEISDYIFQNCSKLTSVTIPDSVVRIGQIAFANCRSLTSVTIGSGVTRINGFAFSKCSTTTELGGTYNILTAAPPTIQSNTFEDAKINKIIVPVGTSAAYKSATNWSALADYIEEADE